MVNDIRQHSRRDLILGVSGTLLSLGAGQISLGQGYCRDGYGQGNCPLSC